MDSFFKRLDKGWIPSNRKWCSQCGRFLPRDARYWTGVISGIMGRYGGRNAKKLENQMIDGVDSLVSDWCIEKRLQKCPCCHLR
jgi:hypothetical protein